MSLQASMNSFKSEMSAAAARSLAHSRPTSTAPARTSTPQPSNKRPHDAVVAGTPAVVSAEKLKTGGEIMTQMVFAQQYLKDKYPDAVTLKDILDYLSLPLDLVKYQKHIRSALIGHDRIARIPENESPTGKEMFVYFPVHNVRNADELKSYLNARKSAQGIPVKELKDGWPNCGDALEKMAAAHEILLTRNKKDDTPKMVYQDAPMFHVKIDRDFQDFWTKCKLPPSEVELRNELEKANLTPTSMVKEPKMVGGRKKEKRKVNRRGGKTTNTHMMGILKDYTRK